MNRHLSLYPFVLFCFIGLTSCQQNSKTFAPILDNNIQLKETILAIEVVADSLNVPWEVASLGDDELIYTEQAGQVSVLNLSTGLKKLLLNIPEVYMKRTTGLLGMAVHPDYPSQPYVYLDYTIKEGKEISSKLVRYTLKHDSLTNAKLLLKIPGGNGHNGSRLAFSAKKRLIWATGDAQQYPNAQNTQSLNGKILRMNDDGSVPTDNPLKGSFVWAWGFRNMQGLTFSKRGQMYTSEHGDALEDEVNLITAKGNYGWPNIEGMHDQDNEIKYANANQTIEPIKSWTPTIAPAGLAYYGNNKIKEWQNSLLLCTLKGRALRMLKLNEAGNQITLDEIVFENIYGRIRAVCVATNGDVFFTSSNRDWNPYSAPAPTDDRIFRIRKVEKAIKKPLVTHSSLEEGLVTDGKQLYNIYCASCHKDNGEGITGVFPGLRGSLIVKGEKNKLIDVFLNGLNTKKMDEKMPSFKFLSDEEGSAILTYIRKSWGNNGSEIDAEEINKKRK